MESSIQTANKIHISFYKDNTCLTLKKTYYLCHSLWLQWLYILTAFHSFSFEEYFYVSVSFRSHVSACEMKWTFCMPNSATFIQWIDVYTAITKKIKSSVSKQAVKSNIEYWQFRWIQIVNTNRLPHSSFIFFRDTILWKCDSLET